MLFLASPSAATPHAMSRRSLPPAASSGSPERWLQEKIFDRPELLLADRFGPQYRRLTSICCELPLPNAGSADWIGLTPRGDIVLTEVKLGRNAEARREVVAQAFEYFAALRRLGYADLERQASTASPTRLMGTEGLYEVAGGADEGLSPGEFTANVERNLRIGNILLIVAVDRAPASLEKMLAAELTDQPGLSFHCGLVELSLYDAADGVVIAPRVVTTITAVTRAVVRVAGATMVEETKGTEDIGASPSRAVPRSIEQFLADLDARHSGLASRLQAFLGEIERLGVSPQVIRTVVLRGGHGDINLGSINAAGMVEFYPTAASNDAGAEKFAAYMAAVRSLDPAARASMKDGAVVSVRCDLAALLARKSDWAHALQDYLDWDEAPLTRAG